MDTSAIDEAVARLEKEGVEAAADVLEEAMEAQRAIAFREWGVETGAGRSSLEVVRSTTGGAFAVQIFSKYRPVRYQSFDGRPPTFWAVLVRRPINKLQRKLLKLSVEAMVEAALGGGGRPKGSGRSRGG